jgi:hypothetical protein
MYQWRLPGQELHPLEIFTSHRRQSLKETENIDMQELFDTSQPKRTAETETETPWNEWNGKSSESMEQIEEMELQKEKLK